MLFGTFSPTATSVSTATGPTHLLLNLPRVPTPRMAQQYGTQIPTPPSTQPTGMGPPDPVIGADPPGDPAASQNVVTMCPDGYTASSVGCVGQGGDTVAPPPIGSGDQQILNQASCARLNATWGCTSGDPGICGCLSNTTGLFVQPGAAAALPASFPWLTIGLGVLGAVVGGLVGRHYKRPAVGASIGGVAGFLGGGYALRNVSFSIGG